MTRFVTLSTAAVTVLTLFSGTGQAQTTPGVRVAPPINVHPLIQKRIGIRSTHIKVSGNSRPHFRLAEQNQILPLQKFGERIDSVESGSPAGRAGLERGDIIVGYTSYTQFGMRTFPLTNRQSLRSAIQNSGNQLRLNVINVRGGERVNVTVRFDGGNQSRPNFAAY